VFIVKNIFFILFVRSYPPNVRSTFEANLEFFEFFPAFFIEEDPEDRKPEGLFNHYGVSPYIVNNLGAFLSNSLAVYLASLAFNLINAILAQQNDALDAFLYAAKRLLIWSFIISYVLSGYLNIVMYSVIAVRWFSLKSKWGTINLCLGITLGVFALLIPFIIIKIIKFLTATSNKNAQSTSGVEYSQSLGYSMINGNKAKEIGESTQFENRKQSFDESKNIDS
jgi:hypothetical protein